MAAEIVQIAKQLTQDEILKPWNYVREHKQSIT
jgi:hypothetical protein